MTAAWPPVYPSVRIFSGFAKVTVNGVSSNSIPPRDWNGKTKYWIFYRKHIIMSVLAKGRGGRVKTI